MFRVYRVYKVYQVYKDYRVCKVGLINTLKKNPTCGPLEPSKERQRHVPRCRLWRAPFTYEEATHLNSGFRV